MNNHVLKKLRNKFFSLLVVGFSTIIFLGFAIVYLTLANTITIENRDKLDSWTEPDELNFDTDFLTIEIDENGAIVEINSDFKMTDKQYEELVDLVLNQPLKINEITYENRTWMYAIREHNSLVPFEWEQNPIVEEVEITHEEVVIELEDQSLISYSIAEKHTGGEILSGESFYEYILRNLDVTNHYNLIFLDITDSRNELSHLFNSLPY